jgi:hypothetical protein
MAPLGYSRLQSIRAISADFPASDLRDRIFNDVSWRCARQAANPWSLRREPESWWSASITAAIRRVGISPVPISHSQSPLTRSPACSLFLRFSRFSSLLRCLFGQQPLQLCSQFQHGQRALRPVVLPAHNQVASARFVSMLKKIVAG